MTITGLRSETMGEGLTEADLDPNPFKQFAKWLGQAVGANLREPNAMTLATATREGRPSARIVLLKGADENGFTFFTNYESQKSRELTENPYAALVLYWNELERQVRITGTVSRTTPEESAVYFATRPRGSQLGAWASAQSGVLASRKELEDRLREVEERFFGKEVSLPPHWGGFRLRPEQIEFWQGRPNRLHDRLRYSRVAGGPWVIERLSP